MNIDDTLDCLLHSYQRYYDISTEDVEQPFCARAVFLSHSEQYFLIKAAKVADIDSNEYVYFAKCDSLSEDYLKELSVKAWELGTSKVVPSYGHRNTDVTVYVVANSIDEKAVKATKKISYSKSYRMGMYGWSSFRLVTIDCSSQKAFYNRRGRILKNVVSNIY